MILRTFRLLAAAVAVVCLAPSRSNAEMQILVEELNASSSVVGSSNFTVGTPTGVNTFSQSFSYSSPTGHFTLDGLLRTNSHLGTPNASLTTSFTAGFTTNYVAIDGHTLRITVTDDGFGSTGASATFTNTAGASSGFAGGTVQVDSFSRLLDSGLMTVPASSTTNLAAGPTLAGPTATASDAVPDNSGLVDTTTANVSGLPSPYAIQQVINVSITQNGTIDQSSTFGGTAGARVEPNAPVPAPGGLALALIGLPLIGLRRALRTRAAV